MDPHLEMVMRHFLRALAVALTLTSGIVAMPDSAAARDNTYFSFRFGGPGFGFSVGRYPRYYPYYYRSPYRYYGYRRYPSYRYSPGPSCSYWARRCAENWGYGGPDYRGCLRYQGCL